jgi:hypothetical protein
MPYISHQESVSAKFINIFSVVTITKKLDSYIGSNGTNLRSYKDLLLSNIVCEFGDFLCDEFVSQIVA